MRSSPLSRTRSVFALTCGALALACGAGCGEGGGAQARGPSPLDALVARSAARARPVATEPVEIAPARVAAHAGGLERPTALRRFFESLAELEAGGASEQDVRIVQFGDSHTAADMETAAVRRALQSRFGDGGRGFVALGKPWKTYLQDGVRAGMTDWLPSLAKLQHGKTTGDGHYGLAGVGLETRRHGARAWTDVRSSAARAEVAYLEQPRGGSFDILVDGERTARVSTRGQRTASAFRSVPMRAGAPHQVEVRAVGDGDVRVFGVSLERDRPGVVYDALGINGARATTCLQWNEEHWAEQLRHRAPSLVVLAYGTNESTDESMSPATYERHLVDLLGRVSRAVPTASCLLLGPPDRAIASGDGWVTSSKLLEIIASQRRVAEAAGCAFYDQLGAMGGEGSVAAWAMEEPPRAQKDRVHLTREGYAQLGSSFASDLMRAYASFRRDAPPTPAPGVPTPAPFGDESAVARGD